MGSVGNAISNRDCLNRGIDSLSRTGLPAPRQDAEIILAYILGCERIDLYLEQTPVGDEDWHEFQRLIGQRCRRVPLQYLTGEVFFGGDKYRVRSGVFIPRPETEILLQSVCGLIKSLRRSDPGTMGELNLADIGTGCGNLAISLTKRFKNCKMQATDISPLALMTARENAEFYQQQEKITFSLGDLFSPLTGEFDLIVANPPYLSEAEMRALEPEVRAEPRLALDGGKDGLDYLIRLIRESPAHLKSGGYLVTEIGDGQFGSLREIFVDSGHFAEVDLRLDLNDRERAVCARKL